MVAPASTLLVETDLRRIARLCHDGFNTLEIAKTMSRGRTIHESTIYNVLPHAKSLPVDPPYLRGGDRHYGRSA